MCGHGTIGIVTIALEENLIKPKVEGVLKIEVPAGTIEVNYKIKNEKVEWVEIINVDSFLADSNLMIHSDYLGEIKFDVSYGGNFYAIIEPQKNYFGLNNYRAEELISFSREIRDKINKKYANRFIHPLDKSISNVSHVLWTGQVLDDESSSRNAVFYGDKAIDRSPCGTGSSARMAQLFSQNKLKVGEIFIHESYIGSKFVCRIQKSSKIHNIDGISPVIRGWAKIHGYNKIIVDSSDPFYQGFQVI
jgi:4-hydroxyproline epimerase